MELVVEVAIYRGAVRPPFIEGDMGYRFMSDDLTIGGQSAPPSLKVEGTQRCWQ